jgi:hypothetical protein
MDEDNDAVAANGEAVAPVSAYVESDNLVNVRYENILGGTAWRDFVLTWVACWT